MRWYSDRTGFPLIEVEEIACAVHLLPVTKIQFEQFLATGEGYGDAWYQSLLDLNPRITPFKYEGRERERFFISGILPGEAEAFTKWLGDDYRLPSAREWVQIYNYANKEFGRGFLDSIPSADRKSTRLNSSHIPLSRMPSSA